MTSLLGVHGVSPAEGEAVDCKSFAIRSGRLHLASAASVLMMSKQGSYRSEKDCYHFSNNVFEGINNCDEILTVCRKKDYVLLGFVRKCVDLLISLLAVRKKIKKNPLATTINSDEDHHVYIEPQF